VPASFSGATLDDWRRHGWGFQYRGHSVVYHDEGAGEVVVCIHGFPTASYDWSRVWPRLRNRYRLIAPDMLGFGFSAKPLDHDYSIHDQATLHEELLRRLGITRCHVLAHDYGDTVAQELLARHEERERVGGAGARLESVCFLNGGLFPETHHARRIQHLLAGPLGPLLARFMNERAFGRSLAAIFGRHTRPTAAEIGDFWRLVAFNDGPRVMPRLIGYMEERRRQRQRWVGALQTTAVPLRLINGPEDPVSGRHMAERYRELVPHPDVVLLDGIGHYPQFEDPEGVVREYLAFLGRARSRVAADPPDSRP
jgi:pimeloyl-ACP methyl ester carboxylesterase